MGNKTLYIVFCIRNYSNICPNKASISCKININKYLDFLRIMCILSTDNKNKVFAKYILR